ncbi:MULTISPECIES: MFS transporter [Streptomyces]|uniref:Metabolite-proton symporter n=2 Tax=Streptomyces TaxID=1883 RepID=A0A117IVU9_9ACTN|nr:MULTISPECIES: MFS transporter [Streptomyces]KUH37940.1 metabolite-proton symporter [Streptomyces kanasensis]UUS29736.1 MFS transporter [Streptomyces changanensis]
MTTSVRDPAGAPGAARSPRALVAASVGNFIEWYEFGVYGYLATVVARNFFTPDGGDGAEALVRTYAAFALAFFFRPVGAVVFGRLGDRIGRRPTLILVLSLMTGATTLMGLLPTYAVAGAAAPWLLTALRVVQGLSAGGEFGGAVAVLTESAPPGRRGLYGAWQSFTVALGLLAGAGAAALVATALTGPQVEAWGWRLPFLLALPLGLTALWLRLALEETPAFRRARATAPAARPAASAREAAVAVVLGAGRLMAWSAAGYTFLVVLPSYLQASLGASLREALAATVVANLGFAAAILPAGALSDRVGRRAVMVSGALLAAVAALPLLRLLQAPDAPPWAKGVAVAAAGAVVGLMAGPGPAMLAEMFPTRVRHTGLGVTYALANAVFSGCAGLLVTELARRTGSADVPAYYVIVCCAVGTLALATLRGDDHRRALRE